MDQHGSQAFLACLDPHHPSGPPLIQPAASQGREQVEKNWSALFEGIPDFHGVVARHCDRG